MENSLITLFPIVISQETLRHVGIVIFQHLDCRSLLRARQCCRTWRNFIDKIPELWIRVYRSFRIHYMLILPIYKEISAINSKFFPPLVKKLILYNYREKPPVGWDFPLMFHHGLNILYSDRALLAKTWPLIEYFHQPSIVLHFCVFTNQTDVLEFLVDNLHDIDRYTGDENWLGTTPLHYAAKFGSIKAIKILLPLYEHPPRNVDGYYPATVAYLSGRHLAFNVIREWFEQLQILNFFHELPMQMFIF